MDVKDQYKVSITPIHGHTSVDSPQIDISNIKRFISIPQQGDIAEFSTVTNKWNAISLGTQGAILYSTGTQVAYVSGSSGQFLKTQGGGNPPLFGSATISSIYGDGTDGSVTISGSSTLSRDMFYETLTVTGNLNTGGYRVFAKTSINNSGIIQRNGNVGGDGGGGGDASGSGSTGTRGSQGTAGGALASGTIFGSLIGALGGQGGSGSGGQGDNGVNGTNSVAAFLTGNGTAGGGGGTGGGPSAGAGGIASTGGTTTEVSRARAKGFFMTPYSFNAFVEGSASGGSGGGGGGGDHSNSNYASGGGGGGGGSGSPGGFLFLASPIITSSGTISALGGNGGNGGKGGNASGSGVGNYGGGGGGGAAGGNGGLIMMIYTTFTNTGVLSVAGGTRGQGGGAGTGASASGSGGSVGVDGTSGTIVQFVN